MNRGEKNMKQLSHKDFHNVRALFQKLDYQLIITAVLDQTSPGKIYVDDIHQPASALMISPEGNFLVGDHQNPAFNADLKTLLIDLMGQTGHLEIQYAHDEWADCVSGMFQIEYPLIFDASYYIYTDLTSPEMPVLSPGWSLHTIDQAFFNRDDIENLDIVLEKIAENWASREVFLEQGLGVCLLHGRKLVSECVADCVSGTCCEVGISTDPDYRRQGLAALTVNAAIAHCQAAGLTAIGWHCANNNLGSVKTAEKTGFVKQRTYPIFEVIPEKFRNLCANGAYHVFHEHWPEAFEMFEKAFALQAPAPRYAYLAAAAYAMTGDAERAKHYLEQALAGGAVTLAQIQADTRFAAFCAVPDGQRLLDAWGA
jgi:RimJ/RimL family protein N-acetyltransferase